MDRKIAQYIKHQAYLVHEYDHLVAGIRKLAEGDREIVIVHVTNAGEFYLPRHLVNDALVAHLATVEREFQDGASRNGG